MNARAHGFSLIELLVVITIIAILASLLMPVIGMMRDSARMLACSSNQRGIGMALLALANDDRGKLPWGQAAPASQSPYYDWPTAVRALDEQVRLTCPSAPVKSGTLHYTSNMQVLALGGFGNPSRRVARAVTTHEVISSAVMLFDGGQDSNRSFNADPSSQRMGLTFYYLDNPYLRLAYQNDVALPPTASGAYTIDNRHSASQRTNFLFADGHTQCLASTAMFNRDFRINSAGRSYW